MIQKKMLCSHGDHCYHGLGHSTWGRTEALDRFVLFGTQKKGWEIKEC
jgi:hypothetical protein